MKPSHGANDSRVEKLLVVSTELVLVKGCSERFRARSSSLEPKRRKYCCRLKSREGLGLVVVDYLQLMSGRTTAENRQVEVSEISRGLKILARELDVPVVALSQLSRNLEMRADKRPVLADLRESGCMPASTRLLRADNGQEVTLGELVLSQEQPLVWSLNEDWEMERRRLVNAFPSGVKPVYRLRLASGYEVEATANHQFRTVTGWTRYQNQSLSKFCYLGNDRR